MNKYTGTLEKSLMAGLLTPSGGYEVIATAFDDVTSQFQLDQCHGM
jgi:hypothetical protein